ncbi:MAG TPA: glycosyltransferase [Phycisphaerales bacterium]|nr:glycosyltransferase [Phycisphaerales bacterium]HMP38582.1 glycosyltransferase [Phycisphaerales bacterium]
MEASPRAPRIDRILILTASVGAGHSRAAEAVEQALRAGSPTAHIELVDALADASGLFRSFYRDGYVACIERLPRCVGWAYDRIDRPWKRHALRDAAEDFCLQRLRRRIERSRADAIVCTHFLPAGIVARLRRRGVAAPWHGVVVTDLHPHALWLHPEIDRYFVGTPEAAAYLDALGIPGSAVDVSGIPIDARFAEAPDRIAARRSLGLPVEGPVVLCSTGGLGLGPVERTASDLVAALPDATFVVVCGRNDQLRARLTPLADASGGSLRVLGFTRQMHELMAAADLFVGKPGGLTSAECLSRGLPMVIVDAVPGQEERNAEHLIEIGAALRCRERATLPWKIGTLLHDPQRLRRMRVSAASHGRPGAAVAVAGAATAACGARGDVPGLAAAADDERSEPRGFPAAAGRIGPPVWDQRSSAPAPREAPTLR